MLSSTLSKLDCAENVSVFIDDLTLLIDREALNLVDIDAFGDLAKDVAL